MFLWILKIHIAFEVLWSCIYIYIYIFLNPKKKKSRFPNLSQKKRKKKKKKKNFKWESVWTRGIGPLSHLKKKKKNFELGPLNFLVTFSKRSNFFFSFEIKNKNKNKRRRRRRRRRRSLLFKMVHEEPLDKIFSKSWYLKA